MNLKKLLTILCVLLVLLSFAGCGENTPTEPEQSQLSSQPTGTEPHLPAEGMTQDTSATETTVPDAAQPTGTEGGTATTESTTQSATQPATEPSTEPTTAPATEPTTEPSTAPATEPTTEPSTEPTTEPVTTKPEKPQLVAEFEAYEAMTGKEQEAFLKSYPGGVPAFIAWYNTAKEAYESYYPDIEIDGSGSVDLGEVTGKNP